MNNSDGLQSFDNPLVSLPHALRDLILKRIQSLMHHEPVIVIMGKPVRGNHPFVMPCFREK